MPIELLVNGVAHSLELEPRTLLVHLLRDELRLTGTKLGCDTSQCGSCTVVIDGLATKSCTVLAAQCSGASVTTIEGLSAPPSLHLLQQAFVEHHALQCGFCTPGMILTALDLLEHDPMADEAAIRRGLKGNLCRCTGYQPIVDAVAAAARELRSSRDSRR